MSNIGDRNKIAEILRDMSVYEHERKRHLLSAIVIRSGDNLEGDGFYKLANELGFGDWQRLKREGLFEIEQISRCIEYWQNDKHYRESY